MVETIKPDVENVENELILPTSLEKTYNIDIPSLITMNRNIMWFPTSVLNCKYAYGKSIKVEWESIDIKTKQKQKHYFEFSPMEGNPLPLPEHSKLLDALLALYANNLNTDIGRLYFRATDVADIAGKKYTDGFRDSLAETIYRYMRCVAFWGNAYLINGRRGNLSCTPIEETSLWDSTAGQKDYTKRKRLLMESPRNSRDKKTWQMVKFHTKIAEVLHNKDTRLFLSEIIKSELRPIPYIIYRYFYAFNDMEYVNRSLAMLAQTFGFKNLYKFPSWLREQLDAIADAGLIDNYVWPEETKDPNKAIVKVKCKSFTQKNPVKDFETDKLKNVDNLTNIALLEYYFEYRKRKLITEETVEILDQIDKSAGKDMFFNALKNVLKRASKNIT